MPNLDLEPHEYNLTDGNGRQIPRAKHRKVARFGFFLAVVMLAFIFFTRDGDGATDIALTAMVAFFGGICAMHWASR